MVLVTIATRCCGTCRDDQIRAIEQIVADVNGITTFPQRDMHGMHGCHLPMRRLGFGVLIGMSLALHRTQALLEPARQAAQALVAGVDDDWRRLHGIRDRVPRKLLEWHADRAYAASGRLRS